jgi:hypothetical protein
MWYFIHARDRADSLQQRLASRPLHLARLQDLQDAGRLLTAGPIPACDSDDPGPEGFLGSLVIAEFDSLESARAWADADPYFEAGVYSEVNVLPFKKVFPV